ncbi:hypothetical protein [Humibacillus xanthopallidus]|uniref:Uncharacterized protein n=1 Tax=Humibacillus xanthopallidus TaxID=412689 RepID=A0A543HWY1_9MICO|nr:hypothetical protein [Humibacillus xanthopallidus]TQM62864.1 hypothetical protein FBY41_2908 [Humibacillus xanthopallidus]
MTDLTTEQNESDELDAENALFVQTATATSSVDGRLTLTGITPSTLYFADRPERATGHLSTQDFVNLWAVGDNSFESDPPNAVLAFLKSPEDAPQDAVVVLRSPVLEDGALRYSIEVLEGTVPETTGPVTLFIDPFGRPLSPVSVCGVRRRGRRRGRRRAMRRF